MRDQIKMKGWLWARTLYLLFAIALYWVSCVNWDAFLYGTVFLLAPWTVLMVAGSLVRGQVRWNAYHILLFVAAAIFMQAAVRNGNLSPGGLLMLALGLATAWVAARVFGNSEGKAPGRGLMKLCFFVMAVILALLVVTAVCEFLDRGDWIPWIAKKAGGRSASERVRLLRARTQSLKGLTVLTYVCGAMLVAGVVPREMDDAYLKRESGVIGLFVAGSALVFIVPALVSVFIGRPIVWAAVPSEKIGIQDVGLFGDRIRALQHPNKVAQLAVIGILGALHGMFNRRRLRGVQVLVIVICLMGMAHAQSRGGNIALGLGVGALAYRVGHRRLEGRRWRIPASLAAGALALILVIVLVNGLFTADVYVANQLNAAAESPTGNLLDALRQDAANKQAEEIASAAAMADSAAEVTDGVVVSRAMASGVMGVFSSGRDLIWKEAMDFLIHHPVDMLFGMGSGDVIDRMKAYNPNRFYSYHLHNGFLEVLARGGVFMLITVLGMLCLMVKPAARMLVAQDAKDPGSCIFPVLVGVLLATAMVEALPFTDASAYNILFFYAAGRVMRG